MHVSFDPGESRLEIRFPDLTRARAFLADARERKHFYLSLEDPAKPQSDVAVALRQGGRALSFQARVVQVFRSGVSGHGTAFQVLDPAELDDERLAEPDSGQEPETESSPDLGETLGASPIFRIQKMNTSQKIRLAPRAGRTERQILLRDPSPQVHMGLLANPHVEDSEVLELVRSRRAVGAILQRVAKDPKWSGNYEIRLAVVRHPRTPTPLAVSLLPKLNRSDLAALARSSNMREAVKGPALRLYLKQM